MIRRDEDGIWIDMEETVSIHHEDAFAALTTSGGLTRWFPVSASVDLRAGGVVVFGWDAKMDRRSTVAILDYDAGGRVTWDWYAAKSDTHAPIYWTVAPNVEKGSVIRFSQGPFRPDVDALLVMAEEALTWRWYLCNLRTTLEAHVDMRKVRPL